MCTAVTAEAEGNEVLLGVGTGLTTEFNMMDLEVRHRAAPLTSPAITTQHQLPQALVRDLV